MARIIGFIALLVAFFVTLFLLEFESGPRGATPAARLSLLERHHEGVALIERHEFTEAEAVLAPLVEEVPEEFVPRFNLGLAQLNQAEKGVDRAIVTLEIAREYGPYEPRVPYCIGIVHRFVGDEEAALAAFRRAVELAPDDPDANYQVAISLAHLDQREQALPYFEIAVRLDPTILGAWNNLQLAYRRAGRIEDADRALAHFQMLKETGRGRGHSTKYTEQGDLCRAIRDWDLAIPADEAAIEIEFTKFEMMAEDPAATPVRPPPAALVDLDLDCHPDLWVAGEHGGVWRIIGDTFVRHDLPAPVRDASTFAVGDIDEDGVPEVVTANGNRVTVHRAQAILPPVLTELQSFEVPGPVAELRLVDLDLESDLDLLIVLADGAPLIAVNEGRALAAPGQPTIPWADGAGVAGLSIAFARDLDGDGDAELGFAGAGGSATLVGVVNAPQWEYTPMDAESLPAVQGTAVDPQAADLGGDLVDDLLVVRDEDAGEGRFGVADGDETVFDDVHTLSIEFGQGTVVGRPTAVTILDVDLDGHLDLALAAPDADGAGAVWILRNDGAGRFERVATFAFDATALIAGDLDDDIDIDLVAIAAGGTPMVFRNETDPSATGEPHHAFRTYLGGARDGDDRRTNLLGYGTRVEVRSGDLAVARTYEGSIGHRAQGIAPLIVGIGERTKIDWIYLVWPDGVSQAERDIGLGGCEKIEEVQRKSSSCPVLFTWDGSEYRFITDFMGGGGLGFWIGPDEYAFPEPTEVVRIAPDALAPIDGELRLSVMEPMQEACYVDRLSLAAVDHPPGSEVYPLEYFPVQGEPPSGAPLLLWEADRRFPVAIEDGAGAIDPALVAEVDRKYAAPRRLDPDLVGYADRSEWIVTFEGGRASQERTYLFLDGWVEYPYSRVNFAAWQGTRRLAAPTFHWDRGDGDWQLIGEELGYPAGMPKTMVLDVTDPLRAGATRFRIDTNLELFWDRMFLAAAVTLSEDAAPVEGVASRIVPLLSAELRFGGYPKEYSDDGALPNTYHYTERDGTLGYRAMGGLLTRYGRVDELIASVDDRFAILGGGDELLLRHDATALPALPDGWRRTYLLDTHGYCKDRDPLTAHPESVEPLPFGTMTAYPPAETDREPDRAQYRRTWNTRQD